MKIFKLLLGCVIAKDTIRKEIRDMSSAEWNKFKDAFNILKEKGYLANISKLHQDVEIYAHRNGRFLPWHRMLLMHVESILQMLTKDPSLGIPYWDWTIDADDPSKSIIFDEDHWGIEKCYLVEFPQSHCLERAKDIEPLYNDKNLKRLLKTKMNYDKFRDVLELVPHALVHMNLKGDMAEMFSTNDPVFWHHHSFIDYIWYQKQVRGLRNSYGGTLDNKTLSIEERLYPFNRQVKDVLSLTKCQVTYKPSKFMKTQGVIKKPSSLSDEYIKKMGYSLEAVRKYESYLRNEDKRGFFRKMIDWILRRSPID